MKCGAFVVFLLVWSVSVPAHGNQLVINTLLDLVIDDITENLSDSSATTISLPDLEGSFKESFFSMGVNATNGVFSDLSTLARSGDASLVLTDNAATINVSVTVGTMQVVYEDTTIWLGENSVSDALSVKIGENSVGVVISLVVLNEGCQITLDSATVGELGDFDLEMNSLGDQAIVIAALTNWIIENFNNKIKTLVEEKIASIIQAELSTLDLCSYL